jgi:hypothetical protein
MLDKKLKVQFVMVKPHIVENSGLGGNCYSGIPERNKGSGLDSDVRHN